MTSDSLYDALDKWRNREMNIARLFSSETIQSRYYQQEKLKHFRHLRNRYGLVSFLRKDTSFNLLRQEIAALEHSLYPNPGLLLLHRALSTLRRVFGPERLIHHTLQLEEAERMKHVVAAALEKYPLEENLAARETNQPHQSDSLTKKNKDMNEKNHYALDQQLKALGFDEGLSQKLKEKMLQGDDKFMLTYQVSFGNDSTVSTLHFKKEGDDFQFQRYNLMLKKQGFEEPLKQSFFINAGQDNFTLKEGYNLMSGRGVFKELSTREGAKYQAWKQLDFKQQDSYGNFVMHTYGEKYGFSLEAALGRHRIKELTDPELKQDLIKSLEKGNQELVTINRDGKETKMIIEATPRFKSLNFYEMNGLKVRADKLYQDQSPQKALDQKQDKQQSATMSDDAGDTGSQKKQRRKRQSIG